MSKQEGVILPHIVSSLDAYIDTIATSRADKIIHKTGQSKLSATAPTPHQPLSQQISPAAPATEYKQKYPGSGLGGYSDSSSILSSPSSHGTSPRKKAAVYSAAVNKVEDDPTVHAEDPIGKRHSPSSVKESIVGAKRSSKDLEHQNIESTKLTFGRAIESLAAIKVHEYAVKRKEKKTRRLKVLDKIRALQLENKMEFQREIQAAASEELAAWKIRFYVEFYRFKKIEKAEVEVKF